MSEDTIQAAITELIPKLLTALEAFEQVQKNFHPHQFAQLAEITAPVGDELRTIYALFKDIEFPEDLAHFKAMMVNSCDYCLRAYDGLANHEEGFGQVMKAMRAHCRAQEHIFPLAPMLSPVNRYFLEVKAREKTELVKTVAESGQQAEPGKSGIFSSENDRDKRGGFSLYVPDYLNADKPVSLVVALHGGTGHGADFLWSWVRESRSRGFIVMAPTSAGDTWSLMGEELDYPRLLAQINWVKRNWSIDESHIMLSGMSDGATYALMAACRDESPFTHIAPFSGVLHPDIAISNAFKAIKNKPVYLVHGTEDWMFPVETAQMANQQLIEAGANVLYREIDGLAHSFARAELPSLLEWFDPALKY